MQDSSFWKAGHTPTLLAAFLAALFAPALGLAFGWQNVFGLCPIPLGVAFAVYLIFAKDAPMSPPPKSLPEYPHVLKDREAFLATEQFDNAPADRRTDLYGIGVAPLAQRDPLFIWRTVAIISLFANLLLYVLLVR